MTRPTPNEGQMAGRLEGVELPVVLRALNRRGATGSLHVESTRTRRTLHLDRGQVSFAVSSDPNDRLGEHLLRMGKISVGELEQALSRQGSGKRLGTLMVEAGIFSEEELTVAVREQIRTVSLDLLTWTEGEYRFDEGPVPEEDITLDMTTEDLLFRGVHQIRSSRLIERGLGTPRTMFRLCDDWAKQSERLGLPETARMLLDRLAQGAASVATLCREVSLSNFKIQQTLWAFKLLGLVETCGRKRDDDRGGRLRDTGLAELLIRCEERGETGMLYISRGTLERSILFAAGRCVFATSNDPDDGLVNFLYRRGVISLHDREETSRRLLSNKRVGTILRELGAIDDDDLQSMVRQQVSEIIYDTLSWEDGEFAFVPSSLPSAEEITLSCGVRRLIAEGVRRERSWTRLVQGCGGVDNPLCLAPGYLDVLDEIDAGVAEWDVVNTLKTPQTPRRVCSRSEIDDFRVCQILWTLKLLGAVEESPIDIPESETDARVASGTDSAPASAQAGEPAGPAEESISLEMVHGFEEPVVPDEGPPLPHAQPVQREEMDEALQAIDESDEEPAGDDASAPEPEEPAPPVYEVSPELKDAIDRFNAMHRVVYRAVRTEVGAGAVNFVRSCREAVETELGEVLDDVTLYSDGTWDAEGLRRAIVEGSIEDPRPAYRRLLEQEFVSLEPHLGERRAGELRQEIWAIEQGSGQHS